MKTFFKTYFGDRNYLLFKFGVGIILAIFFAIFSYLPAIIFLSGYVLSDPLVYYAVNYEKRLDELKKLGKL